MRILGKQRRDLYLMRLIFQRLIFLLALVVVSLKAVGFENAEFFHKDLADYKVLLFLSRICPCSSSHTNYLNGLADKYKSVKFFGVITDIFDESSKLEIQKYYSQENFKFPIIRDDKQSLIKEYHALKTPHTVILKKNNDKSFAVVYEGGVTDSRDFAEAKKYFLGENLEALSNGRPVKYAVGKSLGCYIRRF